MAKEKRPVGRPSGYSLAIGDEICARISQGESLMQICRDATIPHERAVYRWLAENDEFRQKYAHARESQADFYADEIIEIADLVEPDSAAVAKAKLQIDARKWKASKLSPKKYGDKSETVHSGNIALKNDAVDLTDEELQAELVKYGVIQPQNTATST